MSGFAPILYWMKDAPPWNFDPRYLSVGDVAKRLDVSQASVYQWIQKGKLKALKAGKLVRIPEAALDEMLGAESQSPEPQSPNLPNQAYEEQLVDQLGQIIRRIIREEMRS